MPTRAFRPRGLTAETADAQPAAWGYALAARPVGLLLSAWPPPAVQLVAVSETSPPPALAAARWSVQFVAGPALTYRRLGSGEAVPPPTTARATAAFSAPAPSMAELERPALGYGGQLSLRRNLTPHWSASFGLGYAEYATRLALQTIRAKPSVAAGIASTAGSALLDSLGRTGASTALHQRDTYRFVTVPLRVGYAWAPNGRWRVGLLAGADAAVYVGGTSTEGAPCACQPQTWGATGSPYRQLSIGLSLGADVRYRLAGRWELLAQPAATYLLLPLARPVAAYAPRHLFGGWAQLGAAFDLR